MVARRESTLVDFGLAPARVVLYTAARCSLCTRALDVVRQVQVDIGFELEVVSIDGDPGLQARYRELLPVLEIDGERVFTYFVEPAALRARLTP
ncbi:MAG: glutaredoxin family protein [Actinobacteria bacterium]|nr:glutaredoxin family protein [Actinomycetota bacterium]